MSIDICKVKCRVASYLSDKAAQLHYGVRACSPDYTEMELADNLLWIELTESGIAAKARQDSPVPLRSHQYPFPTPSDLANCAYFPGAVPQAGGCQGIVPCIPSYTSS